MLAKFQGFGIGRFLRQGLYSWRFLQGEPCFPTPSLNQSIDFLWECAIDAEDADSLKGSAVQAWKWQVRLTMRLKGMFNKQIHFGHSSPGKIQEPP